MMSEALRNKGRTRNRLLALTVALFTLSVTASAQCNTGRLSLGAGLLYRNGMDVTLAYEHEMNYHNAWEFFANGYLQKFLAGIHLGYEHNYVLRSGWVFFWQVKGDVMIKGADLLRAGVGLGVKLPIR